MSYQSSLTKCSTHITVRSTKTVWLVDSETLYKKAIPPAPTRVHSTKINDTDFVSKLKILTNFLGIIQQEDFRGEQEYCLGKKHGKVSFYLKM